MPTIRQRLELLEKKLNELPEACEAMVLSQFDGYVAGIIISPKPVTPAEWLPLIWDNEGEAECSVFASAQQAEELIGLLIEHYNATIADLGAGGYFPIFEVDASCNIVMWETWIGGFETAMHLRPLSWTAYLDLDEDVTTAIAGLLELVAIANGKSELDQQDVDSLELVAPALIPGWIEILDAARSAIHLESKPPASAPIPAGSVGRTDLCPCGSGKLYELCCGLN